MIRFAPAELYTVCISFAATPDVWRPLYPDGRNIRAYTSIGAAQAVLDEATSRFESDRVCIARLVPEFLPGQQHQPAPTTDEQRSPS